MIGQLANDINVRRAHIRQRESKRFGLYTFIYNLLNFEDSYVLSLKEGMHPAEKFFQMLSAISIWN